MTSSIEADTAEQMSALLGAWLPSQRWFGGKGRQATFVARLLSSGPVEDRISEIWLADAHYEDGAVETYQVPMSLLGEPTEALAHAYIGVLRMTGADGAPRPEMLVYDALHDKAVTNSWLDGIRVGARVGPIAFTRTADADDVPTGATSLVLTGEQSNTSLVFGDLAILKVFRRLQHGENPDVEVHRALNQLWADSADDSRQAGGGRHVPRMLGYVEADADGQVMSLAMLQEFMTTASDGWELAKISVRDLIGEGDLHADEAGGDFAGEAERLGTATALVHLDLRRAFGSERVSAHDTQARAAAMHARLDAALSIVPQLQDVQAGLRDAYDELAAMPDGTVLAQRVHGDLHLGQVLRTIHGWVLLDFEGEPAKSISERRAFDSPVRDVAGMLRSFDYVARHQLIDFASTAQSEYRANEWATRNRDAFCEGYRAVAGTEPIDPVLLRAYEADKAVYEAVYEARNRPSWLVVPLASLARLAAPAPVPPTDQKDTP